MIETAGRYNNYKSIQPNIRDSKYALYMPGNVLWLYEYTSGVLDSWPLKSSGILGDLFTSTQFVEEKTDLWRRIPTWAPIRDPAGAAIWAAPSSYHHAHLLLPRSADAVPYPCCTQMCHIHLILGPLWPGPDRQEVLYRQGLCCLHEGPLPGQVGWVFSLNLVFPSLLFMSIFLPHNSIYMKHPDHSSPPLSMVATFQDP